MDQDLQAWESTRPLLQAQEPLEVEAEHRVPGENYRLSCNLLRLAHVWASNHPRLLHIRISATEQNAGCHWSKPSAVLQQARHKATTELRVIIGQ